MSQKGKTELKQNAEWKYDVGKFKSFKYDNDLEKYRKK